MTAKAEHSYVPKRITVILQFGKQAFEGYIIVNTPCVGLSFRYRKSISDVSLRNVTQQPAFHIGEVYVTSVHE